MFGDKPESIKVMLVQLGTSTCVNNTFQLRWLAGWLGEALI